MARNATNRTTPGSSCHWFQSDAVAVLAGPNYRKGSAAWSRWHDQRVGPTGPTTCRRLSCGTGGRARTGGGSGGGGRRGCRLLLGFVRFPVMGGKQAQEGEEHAEGDDETQEEKGAEDAAIEAEVHVERRNRAELE